MDATKRHTRRSHPNLQVLTVAPLTPNFPLPATDEDDSTPKAPDQRHRPQTPKSYIEPRSLPQTPSLLSRSSSRTRQRPTSHSSIAITDLESATERLKDASLTPQTSRTHHSRPQSSRGLRPTEDSGWILHTASTLTTSTAESKGQAWLATRTSSTSLADTHMHMPLERLETYTADDEFSPVSYRHASRSGSRFGSRRTSRRGSRVGIMTPLGVKSPGEHAEATEYFDSIGVDFVDAAEDEENIEDEGEMKRVVWGRVGGWVDWAVGWMDFRELEEDDSQEEKQDEDEENAAAAGDDASAKGPKSTLKGKEAVRRKPRRQKRIHYESTENIDRIAPAPEDVGVIGDAAWLFGLARNALT